MGQDQSGYDGEAHQGQDSDIPRRDSDKQPVSHGTAHVPTLPPQATPLEDEWIEASVENAYSQGEDETAENSTGDDRQALRFNTVLRTWELACKAIVEGTVHISTKGIECVHSPAGLKRGGRSSATAPWRRGTSASSRSLTSLRTSLNSASFGIKGTTSLCFRGQKASRPDADVEAEATAQLTKGRAIDVRCSQEMDASPAPRIPAGRPPSGPVPTEAAPVDRSVGDLTVVGHAVLKVYSKLSGRELPKISEESEHTIASELHALVHAFGDEKKLQERLRELCDRYHSALGVVPETMPLLKEALMNVVMQALTKSAATSVHMRPRAAKPATLWDSIVKDAWLGFCRCVVGAYVRQLPSDVRAVYTVVASWYDMVAEGIHMDAVESFYKAMFRETPVLQSMFKRNANAQVEMFTEGLNKIITLAGKGGLEAAVPFVRTLAIRHLQYPIEDHDFGTVKASLVEGLRLGLSEEEFDSRIEAAWGSLYDIVADLFIGVLHSSTPVSKAITSNDVNMVRQALAKAPRAQRVSWALQIDLGDELVKLIPDTIRDGQYEISEALLRDVLEIRIDRQAVYWGREKLWELHPDIVQTLASKLPGMLMPFLDGHMWTSKHIVDGQRRVIFYIKELWGDAASKHVFQSPLGQLVNITPDTSLEVFTHPVVLSLLDLKWRLFGFRHFITHAALRTLRLVTCILYIYLGHHNGNPMASLAVAIVHVALVVVAAGWPLSVCIRQKLQASGFVVSVPFLRLGFLVPYRLHDAFEVLNILSSLLCLGLFVLTCVANPYGWLSPTESHLDVRADEPSQLMIVWASWAGFTTATLWLQMTEWFKLATNMSMLFFALRAVIGEVYRYMLVFILWSMSIGSLLFFLQVRRVMRTDHLPEELAYTLPGWSSYAGSDMPVLNVAYFFLLGAAGMYDVNEFVDSADWLERIVALMGLMFAAVLLLNLLVSAMVSVYERLHSDYLELASKSRAALCLQAEDALTQASRKKIFESLDLDQAISRFDSGEEDITGGIEKTFHPDEMGHPAFRQLDRARRYAGACSPEMPWDERECGQPEPSSIPKDVSDLWSKLLQVEENITAQLQKIFKSTHVGADPEGSGGAPELEACDGQHASRQEGAKSTLSWSISASDLKSHSSSSSDGSLWVAVDGTVYDITEYVDHHPGGKRVLSLAAGTEASVAFRSAHKGSALKNAEQRLQSLPVVGRLVAEE